MKIIVLGGGIAGLATSAFLAKQGKHVVVIEKSNSFEDQGAGIRRRWTAFEGTMSLALFCRM